MKSCSVGSRDPRGRVRRSFDHRAEVPIRRGQDADVDLDLLRPTDAAESGSVQHAEELHLGGLAHLADLVQEDGAPVGHLEEAGFRAVGTRKGPTLVAEQLALEQTLL